MTDVDVAMLSGLKLVAGVMKEPLTSSVLSMFDQVPVTRSSYLCDPALPEFHHRVIEQLSS